MTLLYMHESASQNLRNMLAKHKPYLRHLLGSDVPAFKHFPNVHLRGFCVNGPLGFLRVYHADSKVMVVSGSPSIHQLSMSKALNVVRHYCQKRSIAFLDDIGIERRKLCLTSVEGLEAELKCGTILQMHKTVQSPKYAMMLGQFMHATHHMVGELHWDSIGKTACIRMYRKANGYTMTLSNFDRLWLYYTREARRLFHPSHTLCVSFQTIAEKTLRKMVEFDFVRDELGFIKA